MKKFYTLAIVLVPFFGNAQVVLPCTFETDVNDWDFSNYPSSSLAVGYAEHEELNYDTNTTSMVVEMMFRLNEFSDTMFLVMSHERLSLTTTEVFGTLEQNFLPDQGASFEVGVSITVMNWELLQLVGLYRSNFVPVTIPDFVTSIPDQQADNFNVFPNPATDQVTISASTSSADIIDLTARVVKTLPTNTQVSISDLPSGVYFVRPDDDAGTAPKRLVIQ